MSNDSVRSPLSGSGSRPSDQAAAGVSPVPASIPNAIRIAIVQGLDGYLTCCGPDDFKEGEQPDALEAALGWHLEAGHLPAASYWITVELPPMPTIPELRGQAERGEIPRSWVEELNADDEALAERTGA